MLLHRPLPITAKATDSAASFNTAACCLTERDAGTATDPSISPHTAADAYRFATPYSRAAAVAESNE